MWWQQDQRPAMCRQTPLPRPRRERACKHRRGRARLHAPWLGNWSRCSLPRIRRGHCSNWSTASAACAATRERANRCNSGLESAMSERPQVRMRALRSLDTGAGRLDRPLPAGSERAIDREHDGVVRQVLVRAAAFRRVAVIVVEGLETTVEVAQGLACTAAVAAFR